ncbi:hypothetical protein [Halobacillus sp. Marseille-Q1614]|uniref:hypothetical protein n=1 Tax=Halobacillus sp. Marseille-Q1614 TaxID=2709134 RepID=UPI00156FFA67|nr:hypothetical protein [Halobacillus sp. Marseille-Q1614]
MTTVLITLASVAVILLIASFFMNDRLKDVEDQVEQLSIQAMQDTYQVKKKLNVLEEELLSGDESGLPAKKQYFSKPRLEQTIQSMYRGGYSKERIAQETQLNVEDVHSIVSQLEVKGVRK